MFPPEAGTLGEACLATGWSADNCTAAAAENNCLRVAENGRYLKASSTLDIHKIAVWSLNQPLQLMLLQLESLGRVQQVQISV